MSLSKPKLSNPSTRWIEWKGGSGTLRYWDKDADNGKGGKGKEKIIPQPFTFILLDELSGVAGYVKKLESNVFSNEVRDMTRDPMIVKAHKGGVLLEGLYREIKERLPKGASFMGSCYIGFKDESGKLAIGNIKMIGSSLSPWIEFKGSHRNDFGKNAITINGYTEEKNGDVDFLSPKFFSTPVSRETIEAAKKLDIQLQAYLDSYFAQSTTRQASSDSLPEEEPEIEPSIEDEEGAIPGINIPF